MRGLDGEEEEVGEKTRSERERTRAGSRRQRHGAAAADLCAVEEEDERYCCEEESQPLRSSRKDEEERDALGSIARLMNAHVMPAQRLPIDLYIGTMNMVTPAPHRDLSPMRERESARLEEERNEADDAPCQGLCRHRRRAVLRERYGDVRVGARVDADEGEPERDARHERAGPVHRRDARRRKDEERDGQDDRARHHEWQARLGRRVPLVLDDLALVVALLERDGRDRREGDADEDRQEAQADLAGVEAVTHEDDRVGEEEPAAGGTRDQGELARGRGSEEERGRGTHA